MNFHSAVSMNNGKTIHVNELQPQDRDFLREAKYTVEKAIEKIMSRPSLKTILKEVNEIKKYK